jgi:hypothetical protein
VGSTELWRTAITADYGRALASLAANGRSRPRRVYLPVAISLPVLRSMITSRLLLTSRISAWAVAAPIAGSDGTSRELSAFLRGRWRPSLPVMATRVAT